MNKVAAFALRRKNSILSMSEKMFCPPQPLRFWITPAYTGKRIKLRKRHSICGDHPRVCEEKNFLLLMTSRRSGSPPHVRGKGGELSRRMCAKGITPACAGKRRRCCRYRQGAWDHPRACGEKAFFHAWLCCIRGSPPRVRGKAYSKVKPDEYMGITPAHAGKSTKRNRCSNGRRDHPRACGEKEAKTWPKESVWGSPPRMRGKVPVTVFLCFCAGITPAHAGKSCTPSGCRPQSWDHPRACGEKRRCLKTSSASLGSPPRMRGKGQIQHKIGARDGITPAHAGKRLHPATLTNY